MEGTGTGTGPCGVGPGVVGVEVGNLLSAVPVVVLVVYPVHLLRLLLRAVGVVLVVLEVRLLVVELILPLVHRLLTLVNGLGEFTFGLRLSSLPVSLLQLALAARHPSPWVTPRRPVPRCLWFTRFFVTIASPDLLITESIINSGPPAAGLYPHYKKCPPRVHLKDPCTIDE